MESTRTVLKLKNWKILHRLKNYIVYTKNMVSSSNSNIFLSLNSGSISVWYKNN